MEKEELLQKLNWFYTLEVNQVRMYSTQSDQADDPHLARALKKFAEIEQGHVENIREVIEKLGQTASIIGETTGKITGSITGHLPDFANWDKTLEFNVSLEKKAISDYKSLAAKVDDKGIRDVLLNNMLDEELHTFWMEDYIIHPQIEY